MRHLHKGRKLGRSSTHLAAMKRNMACQLFARERISTTVPKAKELRVFAEKIITVAKKAAAALVEAESASGDGQKAARARALHCRRRIIAVLGGKKSVIVGKESIDVTEKLIKDIGPRFKERPGGYTRILKLGTVRLGDAAPKAFIELLGADEPLRRKERKPKQAPAPIPQSAPVTDKASSAEAAATESSPANAS